MEGRVSVTESDLLAALRAERQVGEDGPPDAFTVADLADAMDCSVSVVQKRLKRMIRDGQAEYAGTRLTRDIAGRPQRVPVYRAL